jgi:phytoene dehydrogenase-like protein
MFMLTQGAVSVERNNLIPEQCDVIVIGAGAGGLTAAGLLAKAGLRTVVFESDTNVGGYLDGFQRGDFHFNTSIEWLNQCGPSGYVHKIFSYLGDKFPECPPMRNIRRFKSNSFDYLLSSSPEELREELIRDFPGDERGIRAFFRDAERLGERLRLLDVKTVGRDTMSWHEKLRQGLEMFCWSLPIIRYASTPIDKGLRRYFNCGTQNIFNSHESLMAVMVSIAWASSGNIQSCPLGGSKTIAQWLYDCIVTAGSQVVLNQRVERVLLDDRQNACGVVLAGGRRVNARFVIAACDLQTMYEKMLPTGVIPQRLLKALRNADIYHSSFSIFLGLACNPATLGFGEENLHLTRSDVTRTEQSGGIPQLTMISINAPSLRDPSLAPPGKGTLTIHCPAYLDDADQWHTGAGLDRGEAYRRYKENFANVLLDRVESSIAPELRQHIEVMEIATPVTYLRYTGNTKGSISGAKPTGKNIRSGVAHYQTPVKNLLVGGHCGEYGGGVPMAVKAGTNASLIVLKALAPSAYRQLRDVLNGTAN